MTSFVHSGFSVITWRHDRRGLTRQALASRIRDVVERYRQRRALEELDARMLRDVGISRSEALAEAAKPFWRR